MPQEGDMLNSKNPPDDLQDAGSALWVEIASKYELRPDERAILHDACRLRDLEAGVLSAWGDMGRPMMTRGSQGDAWHPLPSAFEKLTGRIAMLLAKLDLPDDATSAPSNQQRAAANAKWSVPGAGRGA